MKQNGLCVGVKYCEPCVVRALHTHVSTTLPDRYGTLEHCFRNVVVRIADQRQSQRWAFGSWGDLDKRRHDWCCQVPSIAADGNFAGNSIEREHRLNEVGEVTFQA